ncbi:MAG: hypothetical protein E7621_05585 [Ruminococcaceae bacterium]|nr:hypothetical protein [Oscillospiraceae bacterium]
MFIHELYFYYISLKTEFVDIDTYREWLNKAFLDDNNKEDILLELQFCTDNIEKTIELIKIHLYNRQNSVDYHAVMKMIISELKEQYKNKTMLYQLTKKLYNIWTMFPENISSEKPFIILNSIDDPWSWNDEERVEQGIEKLIKYYD